MSRYKWTHATFLHGGCDVCGGTTKHRLFELDSAFRGDDETVASACGSHYKQVKSSHL